MTARAISRACRSSRWPSASGCWPKARSARWPPPIPAGPPRSGRRLPPGRARRHHDNPTARAIPAGDRHHDIVGLRDGPPVITHETHGLGSRRLRHMDGGTAIRLAKSFRVQQTEARFRALADDDHPGAVRRAPHGVIIRRVNRPGRERDKGDGPVDAIRAGRGQVEHRHALNSNRAGAFDPAGLRIDPAQFNNSHVIAAPSDVGFSRQPHGARVVSRRTGSVRPLANPTLAATRRHPSAPHPHFGHRSSLIRPTPFMPPA